MKKVRDASGDECRVMIRCRTLADRVLAVMAEHGLCGAKRPASLRDGRNPANVMLAEGLPNV
jgi:hypothetical protein